MSSGYSPLWRRISYRFLPFLWKKCPAGNYHPRWDRLCFCRLNEHGDNWHGGIYDFKTGAEYHQHQERNQSRATAFGLLYGMPNTPSVMNPPLARRLNMSELGRQLFPVQELPRPANLPLFIAHDIAPPLPEYSLPDDEAEDAAMRYMAEVKETKEPDKNLWDHLKKGETNE